MFSDAVHMELSTLNISVRLLSTSLVSATAILSVNVTDIKWNYLSYKMSQIYGQDVHGGRLILLSSAQATPGTGSGKEGYTPSTFGGEGRSAYFTYTNSDLNGCSLLRFTVKLQQVSGRKSCTQCIQHILLS
jgi:hypothetical protein